MLANQKENNESILNNWSKNLRDIALCGHTDIMLRAPPLKWKYWKYTYFSLVQNKNKSNIKIKLTYILDFACKIKYKTKQIWLKNLLKMFLCTTPELELCLTEPTNRRRHKNEWKKKHWFSVFHFTV